MGWRVTFVLVLAALWGTPIGLALWRTVQFYRAWRATPRPNRSTLGVAVSVCGALLAGLYWFVTLDHPMPPRVVLSRPFALAPGEMTAAFRPVLTGRHEVVVLVSEPVELECALTVTQGQHVLMAFERRGTFPTDSISDEPGEQILLTQHLEIPCTDPCTLRIVTHAVAPIGSPTAQVEVGKGRGGGDGFAYIELFHGLNTWLGRWCALVGWAVLHGWTLRRLTPSVPPPA